jgi:cobyrinic acid a,c-diamide synthase
MQSDSNSLGPLVVAAPASGSGKTTLTLGLLSALKRRALKVAPFKVGPDFIDPGHHAAACGQLSRNLDGWMCGESLVRENFLHGSVGADIALIEGVMGLFDGASGDSDEGSTAEISRWLNGRILLVVDARSQARSAAALVKGFVDFDPRLQFAWVIFNRVGSQRHRELLEQALDSTPGLPPLLGCLPRDTQLDLPERHLGLVTAEDAPTDYSAHAELIERHLDLDRLLASVPPPQSLSPGESMVKGRVREKVAVRIAVARDAAFCFCYPENLERLEAAGAELLFFSPLSDNLPEGIDGLYLPGGYPEIYLEQLAANSGMIERLRVLAESGLPIYAECGGLLLLCAGLNGRTLCGIFPAQARLLNKRKSLGYREVTFSAATPLGPKGTVARGHEFHYSELEMPEAVERSYRLSRKGGADLGCEGFRYKNVLASYVHLHFGSNPRLAVNFVSFCERQREAHHLGTKGNPVCHQDTRRSI